MLSMALAFTPSREAVSRSMTRVGLRRLVLLIGGYVAKLGQRLQLVHHLGRPGRQLFRIGIFQTELILRAADAVFHRQVLHRLHVQRDALDAGNFLLQPLHDGGHVVGALFARLQVDLNAAAVRSGIGAVDADEGRQALHVLVLQDGRRQRLLPLRHGSERDALRRIGNAHDDARVLHREEAFGHDDVEEDGGDQRADSHQQGDGLMLQDELHRAAVEGDGVVEQRAPTSRRSGRAWLRPRCRSSSEHIIGVRVSEMTADSRMVTLRVTANSRKSRPTMSPMNSSGISTAISETVSDTMVKPIWPAPRNAASSGVCPSSM